MSPGAFQMNVAPVLSLLPLVWVTAFALPEKDQIEVPKPQQILFRCIKKVLTLALVAELHVLAIHRPRVLGRLFADLEIPVTPVVNLGVGFGCHDHKTTERNVFDGAKENWRGIIVSENLFSNTGWT